MLRYVSFPFIVTPETRARCKRNPMESKGNKKKKKLLKPNPHSITLLRDAWFATNTIQFRIHSRAINMYGNADVSAGILVFTRHSCSRTVESVPSSGRYSLVQGIQRDGADRVIFGVFKRFETYTTRCLKKVQHSENNRNGMEARSISARSRLHIDRDALLGVCPRLPAIEF
jgi:hypothetical protein